MLEETKTLYPDPKQRLTHEIACLKRENEEHKGILKNLNEELAKARTCAAVVSDNQRKDHLI